MYPWVAPEGTTTTTLLGVVRMMTAGTPLNVTSLASLSRLPEIVTRVPTAAPRGATRTIFEALAAPG